MPLVKVTDDIYTFEFNQKIMPGVTFPARSTIIRLQDDSVAIISPGPFDQESVAAIKELGSRFIIVAPNMFHHFYFLKAGRLWYRELYALVPLRKK